MKNWTKFGQGALFFSALAFLFVGLLNFKSALPYNGLENNLLAANWGESLVVFLTILFGLGWSFEGLFENLVLTRGRKTAMLALLPFDGLLLILVLIGLSSPSDLLHYAISTGMPIFVSGYFFRFSIARPDAVAKLQEHN